MKPSTKATIVIFLDSAIQPALGHLRLGSIARADIARFFHGYRRRKPGGANRCHDILRNMFHCVVAWRHRPEAAKNPCSGIARYGRRHRGRLLGVDNPAKLGAVLRRFETESPLQFGGIRQPRREARAGRLHAEGPSRTIRYAPGGDPALPEREAGPGTNRRIRRGLACCRHSDLRDLIRNECEHKPLIAATYRYSEFLAILGVL